MKIFPLFLALFLVLTSPPVRAAHPAPPDLLRLPEPGHAELRVLLPTLLELTFVTTQRPKARPPDLTRMLSTTDFEVVVDGQPAALTGLGFRRRVLYAPLKKRDLRVGNSVYLELSQPLPTAGAPRTVKLSLPAKLGLGPRRSLTADTHPLRYNPAIHVNQEGYTPQLPKTAMVGYYLGTFGEMPIPARDGFELVDAKSGNSVYRGQLRLRRDVGFNYQPRPYQAVYEAVFTDFDEPGTYQLAVPGLGASLPFRIDAGMMMNFARAYALGLYHQRCGAASELPYSRFHHDPCHLAPASVPLPAASFAKAWDIIGKLNDRKPDHPGPWLKDFRSQLYPFVRRGEIDVSGGHHDAGDYSKYTANSAALIHPLVFAVDAFPGVAGLDNLGGPDSGDGIPDLLQAARWEADFLLKMQDEDGGFYFLVYPRDRRYETGVTPDAGDSQIVWPKNTAVTAAAVAALAQCASSPAFRQHFPDDSARYLAAAQRGWKFLQAALEKHGRAGAYQKLTHYGDQFGHDDEIAWAACELFLATGDEAYEKELFRWLPNPGAPEIRQWGWGRAVFSYGNALRSYAFAARTKRLPPGKLNRHYLAQCEKELLLAGDDATKWSKQSAYGAAFPEATKRQLRGGWHFSSDRAFDITVAHQLEPRADYTEAVVSNINHELGCNPVNVSFITGLGWRQPREIVHQFAQADARVLPPSGLPLGSITADFGYVDHYKTELRDLSLPADDAKTAPYPLYDRWSDAFNVATEFVIINQGRSLASLAYWAAQTPASNQKWKSATAEIVVPAAVAALGRPITVRLESPDLDLSDAQIVWEARDQEPAFGRTYRITPRNAGPQWVEAEARLPDGRRVFATAGFSANSPVVFWVNGALPDGAQPLTTGGDTWEWVEPASKPQELVNSALASVPQHLSAGRDRLHEHGFNHAGATLTVEKGDILFAYVFLDPKDPPRQVMLNWNDGTWEHRAYWGSSLIQYGTEGTPGRRHMGPLPRTGRWVRLEVPASAVALEGQTVMGMAFSLHGGRATWDAAGKMTAATKAANHFPVPGPANETD
jgi:hypothetical protein